MPRLKRARPWLLAVLLALVSGVVLAVEPGEILSDPALEARARALGREIRCLVCQSQSIEDSGADLARDLRLIVRERLVAGDSDEEVRSYLVARYGDFVLFDPPLKPSTYVLWYGPVAVFLVALVAVLVYLGRRRATSPPALTPEERRRVGSLLAEDGRPDHMSGAR